MPAGGREEKEEGEKIITDRHTLEVSGEDK